jgi:hypothetical protein
VPLAALTGWWFLRNRMLYGDVTGNSVVHQMWCCDVIQPLPALRLFLTGLLGRFGQGLMITYPLPVYLGAGLLALVALAGLARLLRPAAAGPSFGALALSGLARLLRPAAAGPSFGALALPLPLPRAFRRPASAQRAGDHTPEVWLSEAARLWLAHVATIGAVGGALVLYAVTVAPGLPGRYLFPAFPALTCLLATGWLAWFRSPRRSMGIVVVLGLSLLAALYALLGMVWPTYRMPPTASRAEVAAMQPLQADIGGVASVLGYSINSPQLHAGDTLTVRVYWQPDARTEKPYTVFIHLFTPEHGSLAQRDTYPGLGNYATSVWDVGRAFVDVYRLTIPAGSPPTENAYILLGLYDGESGQRLPVSGLNAGPPEDSWVEFGRISIR